MQLNVTVWNLVWFDMLFDTDSLAREDNLFVYGLVWVFFFLLIKNKTFACDLR